MDKKNEIYSIPQAAKHCSISRVTLWRWVKTGKLKTFITPGGHHRIRKKDLEEFVSMNRMDLIPSQGNKGKCILTVDDDPKIKLLLKKMLSKESFQVEEAANGFEAGIKVMQINPDLIILDINMPEMDGFEVCSQLKQNPATKGIKILVLTGFDTQENKDRVLVLGADSFLSKPVQKKVLLEEIYSLLGENVK